MSNTFNIVPFVHGNRLHPCRVSYTINNSQPVSCTIIGSEPLFYMDFEEEDDDALLDSSDLPFLEEEIENLKKEIDLFERFSSDFIHPEEKDKKLFDEDKIFITERKKENNSLAIEAVLKILTKSRMAEAYIKFAEANNVKIEHNTQIDDAFYDRAKGLIQIHPRFDLADQVLLTARELRRHWQHRQGVLIHPLMFHPDSAILINRALSADLTGAMIRISWELQLSGIKDAWERIENSPMADLGRAFAYEAFVDFRTLNSGQAAASVFECWFLSERCKCEDRIIIRQMLADNQGYVFNEQQSIKTLTPALISALGSMPYGKNYLAPYAETIIGDPLFSEVRDRSNANFLWFIKFERSFRETERGLQTKPGIPASGTRRDISRTEGTHNDQRQSAEIVELFSGANQESGDKSRKLRDRLKDSDVGKRTKDKDRGNIVYLRRHPGD